MKISLSDRPAKDSYQRSKSLYAVTGLLELANQKNEENRKTWFAETTKLSPKALEVTETTSPVRPLTYANVIEELNLKLTGNTIEDFGIILENDTTYNNQSIRSFGSSKTDESSVTMDPALEFLQDEPLYQLLDTSAVEVSRKVLCLEITFRLAFSRFHVHTRQNSKLYVIFM